MINRNYLSNNSRQIAVDENRTILLDNLPVTEKQLNLAGVPTVFLEGGKGLSLVLLHGPGESAIWWMRVIPDLVTHLHVIVPDLPGHGASGLPEEKLTIDNVLAWLQALIKTTCIQPPVIAGHVLGGALAAHFAIHQPEKIKHLVLVDSLGLNSFRPAPAFAFRLIRFMMQPNEKNYMRFLPQCMYDINELSRQLAGYWKPFLAYNLTCARRPEAKFAMKALMKIIGRPKIPDQVLKKIIVPVALIWGRYAFKNSIKLE